MVIYKLNDGIGNDYDIGAYAENVEIQIEGQDERVPLSEVLKSEVGGTKNGAGEHSVVNGENNEAWGNASIALGNNNKALAEKSFVEGDSNIAGS